MSNVEYRCPAIVNPKTGQKCGIRLFAPPGGTPHHCPNHPDTVYVQTEEYQGPNFDFKAEGEVDPKKTGVITYGAEHVTPRVVDVQPPNMTDDELLVWYREQYLRVTSKRPDMRWGLDTIKANLTTWEEEHTPPPEATTEDEAEGGTESETGEKVEAV